MKAYLLGEIRRVRFHMILIKNLASIVWRRNKRAQYVTLPPRTITAG